VPCRNLNHPCPRWSYSRNPPTKKTCPRSTFARRFQTSFMPASPIIGFASALSIWRGCGSPPERFAVVALRVQSQGTRRVDPLCSRASAPSHSRRPACRRSPSLKARCSTACTAYPTPCDCKPPGIFQNLDGRIDSPSSAGRPGRVNPKILKTCSPLDQSENQKSPADRRGFHTSNSRSICAG